MTDQSLFCPYCGAQQLKTGARFCHTCGQALPALPAVQAPPPPAWPPQPPHPVGGRGRGVGLRLLLAALALLLIALALLAWEPARSRAIYLWNDWRLAATEQANRARDAAPAAAPTGPSEALDTIEASPRPPSPPPPADQLSPSPLPSATPTARPTATPPSRPTFAPTPLASPSASASLAPAAMPIASPAQATSPAATSPQAVPVKPTCSIPVRSEFSVLWNRNWQVLGCPLDGGAIVSPACEQAFQGGHLFWRSDTTQVYMVFDRDRGDGVDLTSGDWFVGPREWGWDGSDPQGIGLQPPEGLYEPIGGLGWLWRKYLGGADGRLGWAVAREHCFERLAVAQTYQKGIAYRSSDPKVYALLPSKRFVSQR